MKIRSCTATLAHSAKFTVLLAAVGLLATVLTAAAASSSELLEKGIYSEETKGDVDAALKLYEQVIAEAKGTQAQAAEAQYRLGVCLYKKKNFAAATAAFEKLSSQYPDQKELIARANEYLANSAALLPAPWTDGEEMRLDIKFPTGFKVGMANYTVNSGEADGRKNLAAQLADLVGVQQFRRIEVEADSFKPIHSRWKHTLIGDVDATYGAGHVDLKNRGKDKVQKVECDGVVYDNEEVVQLIRRLPLAGDYTTTVRILTSLGGGNIIPLKLDVSGPEKVEVPAGTFDCYKIELSLKQTFWYSADAHHYLVKFEAGGIVAELASVTQRKANGPVAYQDPTGFTVTAPPEWVFYREDAKEQSGKLGVSLLDADAITSSDLIVVTLQSFEKIRPEAKKSPRAWADLEVIDGAKELKDLQIRPASWKERTVAGNPAVSMIGDYVEGSEKKIAYAVFSIGTKNATEFRFLVPAGDFESLRPQLDGIVDSYKEK